MQTLTLRVDTRNRTELVDITAAVQKAVASAGFSSGLCSVFVPHTTAAVTINEAADPDVRTDIVMALDQIVPRDAGYRHAEGNSPAHVKASLIGESVTFAVSDGRPVLGTWQGIFFCEFDGPRSRRVNIYLISG